MSSHKSTNLLLLVLVLLLCACASGSSNVVVGTPNTESNNTTAETIRLNNCGGKADAEQTAERSQTISIESEAELGVGYAVLEASVAAKYSRSDTVRKSQKLVAPPETNMEFVLLWTEEVRSGTITIEGKAGQAIYRLNTPIAVELASSRDLECGVSQPVEQTAKAPPTPTRQTIATSPPSTAIRCQDSAPYLAQAQTTGAGKYYLPVPEWDNMASNAQIRVCIYDLTTGTPVAQGVWRNGGLAFPAYSVTRVDGAVVVMSVIWPSLETFTANAPVEFLHTNRMNDTVRGVIANNLSNFSGVRIYENIRGSGGASAEFNLTMP